MERSRFPGTLELITGKFLRHSPEFYQWRIANRLKRLEADPTNAALLDDLAVAYDKTGQHEKAIETALKTEKLHPGRYETAANLGTFYFHSGKLAEGLPHIDRALAINPNAHFGREKYQKLLVEYVLKQRKGGPLKLPLAEVKVSPETVRESPSAHDVMVKETFEEFLHPKDSHTPLSAEEAAPAIKGILGMMKFGKHDSPVLLEALGSLLAPKYGNPTADAKLLAARAYLKASYEVSEGPGRVAYRGMAANAVSGQTRQRDKMERISLEQVEADFQKELAEARDWYAELRERELSWIRDGKDPEAEFDKLYETEPEVSGMNVKDPKLSGGDKIDIAIIIGTVFVGAIAIAVFLGFVACVVILARMQWRRWKTPIETGTKSATRAGEPPA
jgi:tetratricopeptide (TPR) repeat protein